MRFAEQHDPTATSTTPPRRARRRTLVATMILAGLALAPAVGLSPPAALPSAAAADVASPFTVAQAVVRDARRTPRPASGSEVFLYANSSTATTTLTGSGKLVLSVAGNACLGAMPVIAADVNGTRVGTLTVLPTAANAYHVAPIGAPLPHGTHTITVRMINDYSDATCDRNAVLADAQLEYPTPAALPNATTTGVPDGKKLTVHHGDLTITTPGTVIDSRDIRGQVRIKADNVTIRNTIIRGGAELTTYGALVESWWGYKNLTITDSTLAAQNPGAYVDGISGANFTAERLDIYDVVDQVKVIGPNVTVRDSWLHDNYHSDNYPLQPDGKTHDDNVQIEGGNAIVLEHNSMSGAYNAAIMITQNHSATTNVSIRNNQLANGACQINVDEKGKGAITGTAIANNLFGTGRYGATCAMRLPATSPITVTANTWEHTQAQAVANKY